MTNDNTLYKPKYEQSWALVIGINNYQNTSPLSFARHDAEAFADILQSRFSFPPDNIVTLVDQDATREAILASFMRFSEDSILPDDRLVVFFAGHGLTRTARRGEVGYLVPVDGDPRRLDTLVRWDELTRNADLVSAKHVLFVMDACYGGLAVQRSLQPGSARFLKDMLQRYSRQVLTAGKADETVSDCGGPRAGHSIFTGHLLEALDGGVAHSDGVISANAVMAYVYERVSKDPGSQQSPHYGFLDGDGDFIFFAPNLLNLSQNSEEDTDILIQVPATSGAPNGLSTIQPLIERTKDYLSDPGCRIRLDDLVAGEIRAASSMLSENEFPIQTVGVTAEQIAERLRKYQGSLSRLNTVTILLARWATLDYQPLIERVIARLADGTEPRAGTVIWLGLRWYPIMLLMYSGGIAALSTRNYKSLSTLFTTRLGDRLTGRESQAALVSTIEGILEVERYDVFKQLPGHEKQYVPRSEYLFKNIQPDLEDLLFLGNSYEDLFDRFEVLYALVCADLRTQASKRTWGPPGRFAWKYVHDPVHSQFTLLVEEAKQFGDAWELLSAGLFGGSAARFDSVATAYRDDILYKLPWF